MDELAKVVKHESIRTLIWLFIACSIAIGIFVLYLDKL